MVSPDAAWSTAAWMDCPGATTQVRWPPASAVPEGRAASRRPAAAVVVRRRTVLDRRGSWAGLVFGIRPPGELAYAGVAPAQPWGRWGTEWSVTLRGHVGSH